MAEGFLRGIIRRFLLARRGRTHSSARLPNSHPVVHSPARLEHLEQRELLSTTWFVAKSGSDKNPGTLAAPFQSIQAAANVAGAGDTVEIETGTYHETVVPKNSGTTSAPIVFEAYNGETVTVSGADPIDGWSNDTGDIYQAPMSWDLGEGKNEVFVDGKAINEARWPNTSLDLSHPTLEKAPKVTLSGRTATIYDSSLNQPANYWAGALIHITPGQQWTAQTDKVTSSAPGQISFTYSSSSSYENPSAGSSFYLTGTFKALDAAGEWYRDPTSGKLYLWTPGSDNPASHDIEVKHRNYAFDLSNKSNITVHDITIFAATILTNGGSQHTTLNDISAFYISQFLPSTNGWVAPNNSGIVLDGASSLLENSTIQYSAGDGVYVYGSGSRVTNNVIHDVDYSGVDAAAIRVYGYGSQVDHNTIYNAGRDGILQEASKLQITYNTVHDVGLQTTEAGGIYTVNTNGNGTVLAYNQVYNMHSGGFGQTALFLDNNSDGYILHNNNVWNVDIALKLNFTCRNNNIYNNTLNASQYAVFSNFLGDWDGTTLSNNVFLKTAEFGRGSTQKNNSSTAAANVGAGTFASGAGSGVGASNPGSGLGGGTGTGSTGSTGSGSTSTGGSSGSTGTGTKSTGGSSGSTGTGSSSGSGSQSTGGTSTGGSSTSGSGSSGDTSGGDGATPPPPFVLMGPFRPATVSSPPPVTPPSWETIVADDRAALSADIAARKAQLLQLEQTRKTDESAYNAAKQQLSAARRSSKRTPSTVQSTGSVATLTAEITTLLQQIKTDTQNIATHLHTDFTGIHAASQKLAADLKSMHKAAHAK